MPMIRRDSDGRDVTDLPGLWDCSDITRDECSLCSVATDTPPGQLLILDVRKWATSRIPCPECQARCQSTWAQFWHRYHTQRLTAALEALAAKESESP